MAEDYKILQSDNPNNNSSTSTLDHVQHNIGDDDDAFGNELGGARALLQLGNKNQPNDVDVEAAVMKLVGDIDVHNLNNLNNHQINQHGQSNKKRKLQFTDEITNMNEFRQWTGFLEEELNASTQNPTHHHQSGSESQQNEDLNIDEDFLNTDNISPKRNRKSKRKIESLNVDPELAQLDTNVPTLEQEQLVHALIMNARDLENEFNVQAVNDYFKDNQQQEKLQDENSKLIEPKKKRNSRKIKELTSSENAQIVAEVVNKAHPWLISTERMSPQLGLVLEDDSKSKKAKKQRQSISQPSSVQQGKTFSKEETDAIDNYILAFCQINNMTREQMCQRIWSNKRQKDHFWESLQKVLPLRTRASLYKHVRRSYHIFQVRGKWEPEDDIQLGKLLLENPGNWKIIGSIMGRMPEDCRDRFRNYVKCGNNRSSSKWSTEEEMMLRNIINSMILTLGKDGVPPIINWTLVSEQMNGKRSRIQCRYKWNKLQKNQIKDTKSDIINNTKDKQIWLIGQLKNIYNHESEIEWDIMYTIYPFHSEGKDQQDDEFHNGQSLKELYELMKLEYLGKSYTLEQDGRSFVDEMDLLIKKIS